MPLKIFAFCAVTLVSFYSFTTVTTTMPAPKPIEKMLTHCTWKLQEARFLQNTGDDFTYYKRGLTPNEDIYNIDSIKFNDNLSGIYYNSGGVSGFKWSFIDQEKTKINIIFPTGDKINWENVQLAATSLRYTELYYFPSISLRSAGAFYRTKR